MTLGAIFTTFEAKTQKTWLKQLECLEKLSQFARNTDPGIFAQDQSFLSNVHHMLAKKVQRICGKIACILLKRVAETGENTPGDRGQAEGIFLRQLIHFQGKLPQKV